MKRRIFYLFILCFTTCVYAQRQVRDAANLAQEKRNVYEKWGDWKPTNKGLFGSFHPHYLAAWGPFSKKNKRYRRGKDIRPLKADGNESIRYGEVRFQRDRVEELQKSFDSIYNKTLNEFAHWTSIGSQNDPLYLLYYKKALRPFENFPKNPTHGLQWGMDNKTFNKLKSIGAIEELINQIKELEDTFDLAKYADMPRGKRYLLYHKVLIGWRKFSNALYNYKRTYRKIDLYEKYGGDKVISVYNENLERKSDLEIVQAVLDKHIMKLK